MPLTQANRIICPVCGAYLLRLQQLYVDETGRIGACTECLPDEPTTDVTRPAVRRVGR